MSQALAGGTRGQHAHLGCAHALDEGVQVVGVDRLVPGHSRRKLHRCRARLSVQRLALQRVVSPARSTAQAACLLRRHVVGLGVAQRLLRLAHKVAAPCRRSALTGWLHWGTLVCRLCSRALRSLCCARTLICRRPCALSCRWSACALIRLCSRCLQEGPVCNKQAAGTMLHDSRQSILVLRCVGYRTCSLLCRDRAAAELLMPPA